MLDGADDAGDVGRAGCEWDRCCAESQVAPEPVERVP